MLLRKVITALAENHMKLVNTIQFESKIKNLFSNIKTGSTLWFKGVHALGLHSQTYYTYIRENNTHKDVHKKLVRNSVFDWPDNNNKLQYLLFHNKFMPYKNVEGTESMPITLHGMHMCFMMSRIFRKVLSPKGRHCVVFENAIMETTSQRQPTGHNSKSVFSWTASLNKNFQRW
jgi:hypothetical protein